MITVANDTTQLSSVPNYSVSTSILNLVSTLNAFGSVLVYLVVAESCVLMSLKEGLAYLASIATYGFKQA